VTRGRVAAGVVDVTLMTATGCNSTSDTHHPVSATTTEAVVKQSLSARRAATGDPVDILLVGDGTGGSLGSWVFLTMQSLAQQHGRPTVIHEWSFAAGAGYGEPPISVADGTGTPISLWNASMSRNIAFLTDVLPRIRPPSDIDVVLVNNGLDMGPRTLAAESVPLIRTLGETYPQAAVIAILQPTPRKPTKIPDHMRAKVRDLEASARKNDFQMIDVAATVGAAGGTYDGADRYPNSEGQRLWAISDVDALIDDVSVPSS
jgi:hypothetical protein